jgi:predicted PurR-regulated permease PerM
VNGAVVLALLYFGRGVLVPVTLAVILSLLVAPLVRLVRRLVPNQVGAVLGAVVALTLCVGGLAAVIGMQAVAMAGSLPQYESTIRDKIKVMQDVTLGRMQVMQGEAGRMMNGTGDDAGAAPRATLAGPPLTASGAVPVEIRPRTQTPIELMSHVFSSIWGPLGRASIVLIVMVFVLLEHESLRDRFIRLLGGADLRRTTHASTTRASGCRGTSSRSSPSTSAWARRSGWARWPSACRTACCGRC